jgi:hypothetical protein
LKEEAVSLKNKVNSVSPIPDNKARSKNEDVNIDESVALKSKSRKAREDFSQGKS